MFGMIGKFTVVSGRRDEVIGYLLASTGAMPGNIAYLVAADAEDPDTIWVTESWENEQFHQESLTLPEVRSAIAQAMPLITGAETVARTIPVARS